MIIFPASASATLADTTVEVGPTLLSVTLSGVDWFLENLTGWGLGGGVATSFTDRAGAHGMYDAPAFRRARIIGVTGVCIASTRQLALATEEQLAATLADGSLGPFTVFSPNGVRTALVRMSDTPQSAWINPTSFRWQMQFTAPDPRKYGDSQSRVTPLPGGGAGLVWPLGSFFDFGNPGSVGQVACVNSGTAPTEPLITIRGPLLSGFQVTQVETGRRLRYPSSVGDDVVIDNNAGTATTGGQDRTGVMTVREWFTIPPGQTSTLQFSSLGSETFTDPAQMTVTVSPAYR